VISSVIGGVITVVLLSYMSHRASLSGGDGRLYHGAILKAFAWTMALAALGFAYVMVFTDHHGQYVALSLLTGAFGLGGSCMLADAYFAKGTFDRTGIAFETPWTGKKIQKWSELTTVTFNSQMKWYVLTFADGTKMRISNLMHGHGAVLEHVSALGHQVR
jgi:hypothetical protein